MNTNVDGLDVTRVVEVIAEWPEGSERRGSGYRISGGAVLTAGHVVNGAGRVWVRCNADTSEEWSEDAQVLVANDDLVVMVIDRSDGITPVRYGRVRERDAVVACTGLGFPRFKLRHDGLSAYRDLFHLVGSAPVLSNRRSGTLEVSVAYPPGPDPDPLRSAWEGMSGAPVFAAGCLIAVITSNHALEGVGKLQASRIDVLYRSGSQEFRDALGLPPRIEDVQDVLPAVARSLELDMHRADVLSIAPESLHDRVAELEELTEFCSGSDRYLWWQAGPWAGKTALAATFALNPPDGVRVVSFFVTARLAGQADATAYSGSVTRQLAEIAERLLPPDAAGHGLLALLVTEAAERCARRGERLLLIVDGLDEDQGVKPSIAALLPRRLPENLRVLVMSRRHPSLPDDVPGDHPLRHCRIRGLARSAYAQHLELRARAELKDLIQSDPDGSEVVALITASGGGLTIDDLADLTGRRRHEMNWHIDSVFGRSLTSRSVATDHVYLFAHETLRDTAEQILAAELPSYRERLHAWATRYRDQGWPEHTPRYLLEPYGRLLTANGDTDRLAELAIDWRRHERMLAQSRTDQAALTEVSAAERLLTQAPGLTHLTLLAVERQRLTSRSAKVPDDLASTWVRLGYLDHAAALSQSLIEEELAEYGMTLVETGHYDEAADVARQNPIYEMLRVWVALIELAVKEHPARVGPIVVETIATIEFMTSYNTTLALFFDLIEVLRPYPSYTSKIIEKVTTLLSQNVGEFDSRLDKLHSSLVPALAEPDQALLVMDEALQDFGSLHETDRVRQATWVIDALTRTASVLDQPSTYGRLMAAIDDVLKSSQNGFRLEQRAVVAVVLAEVDPARGLELAKECLSETNSVLDAAHPDMDDRWERYDPGIASEWGRLVAVIARTAVPEEARTLLLDLPGFPLEPRVEACCALIKAGAVDDPSEVRELVLRTAELARTSIHSPRLLAMAAAAAAVAADHKLATDLASEAERAAREPPDPHEWRIAKENLIRALVRLGHLTEAETLFQSGHVSASVLADLALGHSVTSPKDTLRLLDGIDHRSSWRDVQGRVLDKITNEDLAKASAALSAIQPERSAALATRAVNRAKSRTNINKYWQGLFDVLAHVAPAQSDHIFAELANDLHSIETWPPRRRLQLARVLLRFDPQRATELIDQGRLSDKKEYLVDRVAVLAVTAPELAAELAERTLHEHDSLTADELAAALLGEPGLPGAPTLRPIAHDCVRAALADDTSWSYTLPQIAELEPQAVIAVFDRLQELNTIGR